MRTFILTAVIYNVFVIIILRSFIISVTKMNNKTKGDIMSDEELLILEPVSASVINSNFHCIEDAVNGKANLNGDREETFEVADATEDSEAVNKGQLEDYLASYVSPSANPLTPNCINSGELSGGEANVISYSGNTVTLAANTAYTTYQRESSTTAAALGISIDTTPVSVTWNMFIEDGTLAAYNNTIYKQKTTPAGSADAVWIDLSTEPVIQYKWNSGTSAFEEYEGVYCGQAVTDASGNVSSVAQPRFNENGYVACKSTVSTQAMPSDIYINVTLASTAGNFSTGAYFTAPANGYFCIATTNCIHVDGFIYMANGQIRTEGKGNSNVNINAYLPCKKGQAVFYCWYGLATNSAHGYFTYSEGEV